MWGFPETLNIWGFPENPKKVILVGPKKKVTIGIFPAIPNISVFPRNDPKLGSLT